MNTLRPGFPPPSFGAQPKPQPPAGQGGIFELARAQAAAKAAAASAPVLAPRAVPVATSVQRVAQVPDEAPSRPLRPGSLLDIRV